VQPINNYDWAEHLLQAAHLPVGLNLCSIVRWMAAENPPSDWFRNWNPLNVADFTGPTHGFSGWFVAAYGTAKVLLQPNMWGIRQALTEKPGDLDAFSIAAAASPWSALHYHSPLYIAEIPQPAVVTAPQ
jgi:hypothetical protein